MAEKFEPVANSESMFFADDVFEALMGIDFSTKGSGWLSADSHCHLTTINRDQWRQFAARTGLKHLHH